MRLKILGSGGYYPTKTRQTACYLVNNNILLDAGSGVLNLKPEDLAEEVSILLSHTHLDHVCGLAYLYGFRESLGCKFTVWCSESERDFLTANFFGSRLFEPTADFLDFQIIETEMVIGGLNVQSVPQKHGNNGSRGFVFSNILAYFTDTRPHEVLEPMELILHEAYNLDKDDEAHSSVKTVTEVFLRSQAKMLGFIHVNPTFKETEERLMEEMSNAIPSRFVAKDGMILDL